MVVNITNNCEEMCSHCMMNSSNNEQHMNQETLDNLKDFLIKTNPLLINISGGEITTHPEFKYFIKTICEAVPKATVCLLSNGSFFKDEHKVKDIIDLLNSQSNINTLQIRTDKRFYSNYGEIVENKEKIETLHHKIKIFDGEIDVLPFGRACIHHKDIINWNRKPICSNPYLIARQFKLTSFSEFHKALIIQAKTLCKPLIFFDGNIHIGESNLCNIVGNVSESPDDILKRIQTTVPCDKCGLVKNYAQNFKELIFGI